MGGRPTEPFPTAPQYGIILWYHLEALEGDVKRRGSFVGQRIPTGRDYKGPVTRRHFMNAKRDR